MIDESRQTFVYDLQLHVSLLHINFASTHLTCCLTEYMTVIYWHICTHPEQVHASENDRPDYNYLDRCLQTDTILSKISFFSLITLYSWINLSHKAGLLLK